jgi:hypothetical protein
MHKMKTEKTTSEKKKKKRGKEKANMKNGQELASPSLDHRKDSRTNASSHRSRDPSSRPQTNNIRFSLSEHKCFSPEESMDSSRASQLPHAEE